jgi:hypothetical protein
VVVAVHKFLDRLPAFICQEVEIGHVLSVIEDGDSWLVVKVEVGKPSHGARLETPG